MKKLLAIFLIFFSLSAVAQITILEGGGVVGGGGVGGSSSSGGGGGASIDPWMPATAYITNDIVIYNNTLYRRAIAGSTPTAPDQDNTNWDQVDGNYLAQWNAANYYHIGNVVEYSGYFYVRLVAGLTAGDPASDGTNWAAVDVDASNITGILPQANGGLGYDATTSTDGQLLIGDTGTGFVSASLTGTLNQINIANGAGSITLSTPQDIHSGASPTFVSAIFSGVLPNEFLRTNGTSGLTSVASIDLSSDVGVSVLPIANGGTNSSTALNNDRIMVSSGGSIVEGSALADGELLIGQSGGAPSASTLTGTLNQINVANGAGSITLSTPQDIHSGASPTFASATFSGVLANAFLRTNGANGLDSVASIDLTSDVGTSVLPIANGGTNSATALNDDRVMLSSGGAIVESSALADGQFIIGATSGAPDVGTIGGTVNQVNIAYASNSITASLPQDIHSGATPTFASVTLSSLLPNQFVTTDGSSQLTTASTIDFSDITGIVPQAQGGLGFDVTTMTDGQLLIGQTGLGAVSASLTGTLNQVNITNGAGSVTLSTPQDIHSGASPTFVSATFSGVTPNEFLRTDGASGLTSVASIDLTSDVGVSVLPIANGGTNSSTALTNDQLMFSSGGSIVELGAISTGQFVVGSGSAPSIVTMSGDVTVDALGVTTLGEDVAATGQMNRIGTPTYSTINDMQTTFHSSGVVIGGEITSGATAGNIDIAGGTVMIRDAANDTATLYFADFAAVSDTALTDNSINYVYVEYNAGSPQVVVTPVERMDRFTNILLGTVRREGTELHFSVYNAEVVADHAALMVARANATAPFAPSSKDPFNLSETGTRNIAGTSATWWQGLNEFSTTSFDTSGADDFDYYYQDGGGGWTEVSAQSQINNTQYDDGSGTLATLSNNDFGLHWVYLSQDSDVIVLYGRDSYDSGTADNTAPPSNLPPIITEGQHARLVGKIKIEKDSATFEYAQTVLDSKAFQSFIPTSHASLGGLTNDDHAQYLNINGRVGGQTAIGGTGASENLVLDSTSNATKGNIVLNSGGGKVSIGTAAPDTSAIVDITSIDKGFLPPRMTEAQRDAITTPATGLMIFNTDINQPEYYNGTGWISY